MSISSSVGARTNRAVSPLWMKGAYVSRTLPTTKGSTSSAASSGVIAAGTPAVVSCISSTKTFVAGKPSYFSRFTASSAMPFDSNSPTTNLSAITFPHPMPSRLLVERRGERSGCAAQRQRYRLERREGRSGTGLRNLTLPRSVDASIPECWCFYEVPHCRMRRKGPVMTTILIIVLLVLLLGGFGGYHGYHRYGGGGGGGGVWVLVVVLSALLVVCGGAAPRNTPPRR